MPWSTSRWLALSAVLLATACTDAASGPVTPRTSTTDASDISGVSDAPSPDATADASPSATPAGSIRLGLADVAGDLDVPVWGASPGDGRTWIAERVGRIVVVDGDGVRGEPVVDLTSRVLAGGERGLLAFEFLDDDGDGGADRLLVHYSARPDGRTRLSTLDLDLESATADPASEAVLLEVPQPAGNHNGGSAVLGPDGNVWIGLGDGGGARDQFGQAQRADTLLGAILRIRVEAPGAGYSIPDDNPFVDGGAPEVWAIGARNPWRLAFDGDRLYIADVGQDLREEISVVDATDHIGLNLGWPLREGSECFSGDCGEGAELVDPVVEFGHDEGCSVIGGLVYRGAAMPALHGHYFYSDLCGGFLRSFLLADDGTVTEQRDWTGQVGTLGAPLSFGLDADGELLVLTADGSVRRIVPA